MMEVYLEGVHNYRIVEQNHVAKAVKAGNEEIDFGLGLITQN